MTKIHQFKQNRFINLKGNLYDLNSPKIMGIINCTPDSFYSESRKTQIDQILKTIESMLENGVDIIDIGGASTRPNALIPSVEEEIDRILEPIKAVRKEFKDLVISLDTMRYEVAKVGIDEGISIINDVSGGLYDKMLTEFVGQKKIPYILTFNNGNQINTVPLDSKRNILTESVIFFSERIKDLKNQGVNDIIIDPGFGFDKTLEENFRLLNNLEILQILEKPILVGISRKSMIYKKIEINSEESLNGTTILNTATFLKGASIFRVHDVLEMNQIRQLLNANT
jgi:dihydropteroate synthase